MNMNEFESKCVAINLPLFRFYCLHRLLNPNIKSIFDFNAYRLIIFVITLITLLMTLVVWFSTLTDDVTTNDDVQMMQLLLIYTVYFRTVLIVITCVYKANDIWNLFDVTRVNFLTAGDCQKHIHVLHKYRKLSIQITNFISLFLIETDIVWILSPFVLNGSSSSPPHEADVINQRNRSILDLSFPVSVYVYNNYYFAFYAMELLFLMQMAYVNLVFNIYFISFCCVFIAQYKIISLTFENIAYKDRKDRINESKSIFYLFFFYQTFIVFMVTDINILCYINLVTLQRN